MNERIRELAEQAGYDISPFYTGEDNYQIPHYKNEKLEKFAELIVRMCADYADMAQDAGCEYAGDYVAEAMGYGVEEGIATWRAKI